MNCQEYLKLDQPRQIELIGKVIHLLQNESAYFTAFSTFVAGAEKDGKFEKVKFGNYEIHKEEENTTS